MQNLLEDFRNAVLNSEQKELYTDENGRLLKNKLVEDALRFDAGLLRIILQNESLKKHFLTETDGMFIFDKVKFQQFVSNKQFLPDSYTAFKNKIGLVNEDRNYFTDSREIVLAWPYKDCVLEGGQTKDDQKRNEIFWNETLAPDEIDRLLDHKAFCNFKRYVKQDEEFKGERERERDGKYINK